VGAKSQGSLWQENLHELGFLKATFRKMVIVSNRYDGSSNWLLEPLSWKKSPPWLLFLHISHMTYGWLSRTLAKHNTLCIGMLPRNISKSPSSCEEQPGTDSGSLQHILSVIRCTSDTLVDL
jgi:hypothetical protein